MQILAPSQRRQVEELAQQEGLTCPCCGSSELVSENRAQISFGGVHNGKRYNAEVNLECENERCYPPGRAALYLSVEEAESLGINMTPRDFPET